MLDVQSFERELIFYHMFSTPFSLFYLFDLLGISVFAISGALAAGRKGLDLLGIIIISIVTAVGGGTLRDILLDRSPIFWIADPGYLVVIIISSFIAIWYVRKNKPPFRALLIADALGLAFFTIMGTQITDSYGFHPMIPVVMGTVTGVAGGVVRDILSAEVPLILRRDIYASAAIGGSIIYLLFSYLGFGMVFSYVAGIITVLFLRSLAIIWGVRLPVFRLPDKPS
ncbi:MAG: membrane protein [Melioribacteraceae bacterium]|nr:MAG: membrane protein [Melioribacteraceae bacterium]